MARGEAASLEIGTSTFAETRPGMERQTLIRDERICSMIAQ